MAVRGVRRSLHDRAADLDARAGRQAGNVRQPRLPKPRGEGSQPGELHQDQLSQRLLLPLLVYAVDKRSIRAVKILFDENPRGVRSKFITHNLGKARIEWLREKGLLDG